MTDRLKVLCPNGCGLVLVVELPQESFHNACTLGRIIGDALIAHDEGCARYYDDDVELTTTPMRRV
jgi:hypothetical protein